MPTLFLDMTQETYSFVWQDMPPDLARAIRAVPMRQHPLYAQAMRDVNVSAAYLHVYQATKAIAAFLVLQKRVLWQRLALVLDGGIWYAGLPEDQKFYRQLRHEIRSKGLPILELQEFQKPLRALMTPRYVLRLDISKEEAWLRAALEGKWRNSLAKAQGAGVSVVKEREAGWLYMQDARQQKQKRFLALPSFFADTFLRHSQAVVLSARLHASAERVAGAMFIIHGNAATYHIAWNSKAGREVNAANLLLWEGIRQLKTKGVSTLYLGDSDTRNEGLMRFKLGLGNVMLSPYQMVI